VEQTAAAVNQFVKTSVRMLKSTALMTAIPDSGPTLDRVSTDNQ
jgi:hypothetical protein